MGNRMVRTYAFLQSVLVGLRDRESAQTMAEYVVVLGVITAAIVVTIALLSGGITTSLSSTTSRL
jgi:Flp pilus assembly pilin Flp